MIEPAAAAMLAIGVDEVGTEGPDVPERLAMLAQEMGVELEGLKDHDVVTILEALHDRIAEIGDRIKRLEDRP